MSALKFKFRAGKTALRALYAGQAAPPAPDGTLPPASATPSVSYKRKPVWRFVRADRRAGRRRAARRAHQDQDLQDHQAAGPQGPRAHGRAARRGDPADRRRPGRSRASSPARSCKIAPKIRTKELAKAYPSVITIDQSSFRLRLFKRLKFVKGYGVAVGQPAYPTPNGRFALQSKQVNPTWTAPNSPWAGEMGGQSVGGGAANNPLKARWMGVSGAVGIHGTGEPWSIGTRASHGCIRMAVPDVIDLFDRVSVGTPVLIAP